MEEEEAGWTELEVREEEEDCAWLAGVWDAAGVVLVRSVVRDAVIAVLAPVAPVALMVVFDMPYGAAMAEPARRRAIERKEVWVYILMVVDEGRVG